MEQNASGVLDDRHSNGPFLVGDPANKVFFQSWSHRDTWIFEATAGANPLPVFRWTPTLSHTGLPPITYTRNSMVTGEISIMVMELALPALPPTLPLPPTPPLPMLNTTDLGLTSEPTSTAIATGSPDTTNGGTLQSVDEIETTMASPINSSDSTLTSADSTSMGFPAPVSMATFDIVAQSVDQTAEQSLFDVLLFASPDIADFAETIPSPIANFESTGASEPSEIPPGTTVEETAMTSLTLFDGAIALD